LEADSCKQAPESVPSIGPRHDGSNYFLVNARDFRGNQTGVVKFRIDLEYDLIRLENYPRAGYFYFTLPFRLVSFWDLFDRVPGSRSAPFLETNYAPGLEVGWVLPTKALSTDSEDTIKAERHALTFGVLHESNGVGTVGNPFADSLKDSRSWNRWYVTGRLALIDRPSFLLTSSLTVWYPWGSDVVDGWPDGSTARAPLQEYMGYGELLMRARVHLSPWFDFGLRAVARQHSVEAELRWSIKRAQFLDRVAVHGNGFRVDLVFLCFNGWGERLMVANELHTSCYAGLGL
jgi:outer membrane phospholipase A